MVDLQFTLGPEVGFGLSSRENGFASVLEGIWSGVGYGTNMKRSIPAVDFRLRGMITAYYHNLGINVGYSYGLTNYQSELIGADKEVYADLIRFGLAWRFTL